MSKKIQLLIALMGSIIFLIGLSGCLGTSPRVNYYVISPIETFETPSGETHGTTGPAIGVGPVKMPMYLDRQQIITRDNPNQIEVSEIHQWAEPLKHNIERVLAENLSIMLDAQFVLTYPYSRQSGVEFQIPVIVLKFDAGPGADTHLKVRWAIIRAADEEKLFVKVSEFTVPYEGTEYHALVAAHSQALGELSREIAGEVKRIYANEH
jgi:uncharacterized lipoprotein YmbA